MNEIIEPSQMDKIEASIAAMPCVDLPLIHRFTPGLYIREIFIPAGTILTSMKHLTEHPFFVMEGQIAVMMDSPEGLKVEGRFCAGYIGITQPGTKRILFAESNVRWATVHRSDLTDPVEITQAITEPISNPLAKGPDDPRFNGWRHSSSITLTPEKLT